MEDKTLEGSARRLPSPLGQEGFNLSIPSSESGGFRRLSKPASKVDRLRKESRFDERMTGKLK